MATAIKKPSESVSKFLGTELTIEELEELNLGNLKIEIGSDGLVSKVFLKTPDLDRNLKYRLIAYLLARGFEKSDVEKVTGYSRQAINNIIKIPDVKEMALKFQDKIIEKLEADKQLALVRLGALSMDAVQALEDGLYSADEKVKFQSATKILEGLGVFDKKGAGTTVDVGIQLTQLIADGYNPAPIITVESNNKIEEATEIVDG